MKKIFKFRKLLGLTLATVIINTVILSSASIVQAYGMGFNSRGGGEYGFGKLFRHSLVDDLDLTDEQEEKLDALKDEKNTSRSSISMKQIKFSELFEDKTVSKADVVAKINAALENQYARVELSVNNVIEISKLLNQEQRNILADNISKNKFNESRRSKRSKRSKKNNNSDKLVDRVSRRADLDEVQKKLLQDLITPTYSTIKDVNFIKYKSDIKSLILTAKTGDSSQKILNDIKDKITQITQNADDIADKFLAFRNSLSKEKLEDFKNYFEEKEQTRM